RGRVVPRGRFDPCRETDVAAEVVLVGDVAQIAEDLGLRRVSFRPLPLGLELRIEAVRVVDALDVAPGARVAVPVPRAAHVVAALDDGGCEPETPQPVEHVEASEPGTHHDDVGLPVAALALPNVPCGHRTPFSHEMSPEVDGGYKALPSGDECQRGFGPPTDINPIWAVASRPQSRGGVAARRPAYEPAQSAAGVILDDQRGALSDSRSASSFQVATRAVRHRHR